jgi:fructose transport system ATP-binding protein
MGQMVETLSGGQRQGVAVARAATFGQRVIIMDEPTAALGVKESQKVL